MHESPEQLRGRTAPWGTGAWLALAALTAFGLWLRLRGLSAEGFGDDEVHKWLAANRYLHGVFSGERRRAPDADEVADRPARSRSVPAWGGRRRR